MKVVAFVTIKLNSSRLPRKNVLPLGGHPLCWHICDTLLACETIDEIYIYCSDEQVMGYVPQDERLIFRKRSAHLDGDLVRAQEIYSAFVDEVDADVYVAALTTAPFITARSIDAGVHAVLSGAHDSAFSAQSIQTFAWYQGQPLNYAPESIPRTQDLQPVLVETSGFFAFRKELWTQHRRRIGSTPHIQIVDAVEAVDIDTKEDYELAQRLWQRREDER